MPGKQYLVLAEETLTVLILPKFTSGNLLERTHFPNAIYTSCFCPSRQVRDL